jgi:hypothetical protein
MRRLFAIAAACAGLTIAACGQPGNQPPAGGSGATPDTTGRANTAKANSTSATHTAGQSRSAGTDAFGAAPAPAAPRPPETREITLAAGTRVPIVLDTAIGSDSSRPEEPVSAHVAQPLVVDGVTVVPEGSRVGGTVTSAARSGRVKGRAHVAVRFDTLAPRGSDARYTIDAAPVARTAESTKKKDALEIGAPAAGGALIGALVGGGKGALIGTAAGGGAGTAVVLSTRGKEVRLPAGSTLTLRLAQPLTIRVPIN